MGTSYGVNPATGRYVLDCGECGRADGTVRKRRCPAPDYCPPAQLCAVDYAKVRADGRWAEWHADCAASLARSREIEAAKDREPELWARSARGDWAPDVPAGMVHVVTRAGTEVLLPSDAYAPSIRGFGTLPKPGEGAARRMLAFPRGTRCAATGELIDNPMPVGYGWHDRDRTAWIAFRIATEARAEHGHEAGWCAHGAGPCSHEIDCPHPPESRTAAA